MTETQRMSSFYDLYIHMCKQRYPNGNNVKDSFLPC